MGTYLITTIAYGLGHVVFNRVKLVGILSIEKMNIFFSPLKTLLYCLVILSASSKLIGIMHTG